MNRWGKSLNKSLADKNTQIDKKVNDTYGDITWTNIPKIEKTYGFSWKEIIDMFANYTSLCKMASFHRSKEDLNR